MTDVLVGLFRIQNASKANLALSDTHCKT